MHLDELLRKRRERLATERRIERRGPDCLRFADLARIAAPDGTPDPMVSDHVSTCDRCASLLRRMHAGTRGSGAPESDRRAWQRTLVASALLAVAACLVAALVFGWPSRKGETPRTLGLGDLFEEGSPDGLLAGLLNRGLDEAEPMFAPVDLLEGGIERHVATIRGARFWGYCNPFGTGAPGTACEERDCEGAPGGPGDPCIDPEFAPTCRESRMTVEIYLPPDARPDAAVPESSVLLVMRAPAPMDPEGGGGEPAGGRHRRLARSMAAAGIPAVVWYEADLLPSPEGSEAIRPLCRQFGYETDGALEEGSRRWMMARDPGSLKLRDLRFDIRFARAQFHVLATSFYEAVLRERLFAGHPDVETWLGGLRVCYAESVFPASQENEARAGDRDAGCVTAAGIDPRAVALFSGGSRHFGDGPKSAFHRVETDWSICPPDDVKSPCDRPPSPGDAMEYEEFAGWAWRHRDRTASYFNAYLPARNAARYHRLLLLGTSPTHDPRVPLGADTTLAGGSVRLVRRVNCGPGGAYAARGLSGVPWSADELLLWRSMLHLRHGDPLPVVELIRVETDDPGEWVAVLRVTGDDPLTDAPETNAPPVEGIAVHVAASDDRDFRRCAAPILCGDGGLSCEDASDCREPEWDDNKEFEDLFVTVDVPPDSVRASGEFLVVPFPPPPELTGFESPPLAAVLLEVQFRVETPGPAELADGLVLFTEVVFVNESLYPAYVCRD